MADIYSIDLNGKYVYRANGGQLEYSNNVTYEAWFKFGALPSIDNTMSLFSKWTGGTNGIHWFLFNNNGTMQIWLRVFNGSNTSTVSVNITLSTGIWTHLAVTFSSGSVNFYKNGTNIGSGTMGSGVNTIAGTSANLTIGSYDNGQTIINALVNDARVWNVARTGTQISDNYRNELVGNESNLQGYWKFENDLNDSTANAYHLTASATPSYSTSVPIQYKSLTETMTLADIVSALRTIVTQRTESLAIADTIIKATNKVLTESITIGNTLTKLIPPTSNTPVYLSSNTNSDGGTISDVEVRNNQLNNLFPDVTQDEARNGATTYRKVFIKNYGLAATWEDVRVFLGSIDDYTADSYAVGLGTADDTDGSAIVYSSPTTRNSGVLIGDLAVGQSQGVWIRRIVSPGAEVYKKSNDFIIYFGGV